MPLNKGCSLSAFRDNISKLVGEGYSNKQAVAIAADTLRRSCKALDRPLPEIGEIVPPAWEIEVVLEEAPTGASELDPNPESETKKADFPFRPTGIWGLFDYRK